MRAALFALVGVVFFAHWLLADPGYDVSEFQSDWTYVLAFSAAILALAFALPLFAQLVGGRVVFRVSLVPAAGASLSSLANVVEDGLQMDWAFYGFVLGSAIMGLGLLTLTVVIAFVGRGGHRLALIPAGTMAGVILYVIAGGPLMLATWLTAAAVALALPARTEGAFAASARS